MYLIVFLNMTMFSQKKNSLPLNYFLKNIKIYIIENKKYRVDYFCKAYDPKNAIRYTLPPV